MSSDPLEINQNRIKWEMILTFFSFRYNTATARCGAIEWRTEQHTWGRQTANGVRKLNLMSSLSHQKLYFLFNHGMKGSVADFRPFHLYACISSKVWPHSLSCNMHFQQLSRPKFKTHRIVRRAIATAASSGSYETFNTFSCARQTTGERSKFKSWIEKENSSSQFHQEFKMQTKCGEI